MIILKFVVVWLSLVVQETVPEYERQNTLVAIGSNDFEADGSPSWERVLILEAWNKDSNLTADERENIKSFVLDQQRIKLAAVREINRTTPGNVAALMIVESECNAAIRRSACEVIGEEIVTKLGRETFQRHFESHPAGETLLYPKFIDELSLSEKQQVDIKAFVRNQRDKMQVATHRILQQEMVDLLDLFTPVQREKIKLALDWEQFMQLAPLSRSLLQIQKTRQYAPSVQCSGIKNNHVDVVFFARQERIQDHLELTVQQEQELRTLLNTSRKLDDRQSNPDSYEDGILAVLLPVQVETLKRESLWILMRHVSPLNVLLLDDIKDSLMISSSEESDLVRKYQQLVDETDEKLGKLKQNLRNELLGILTGRQRALLESKLATPLVNET